jgi:hypothetical protein
MRMLKTFFTSILFAFTLIACGSGGDTDDAAVSAVANLYTAYDKVTPGMSYDQVKAAVGYGVNSPVEDFGSGTHYTWKVGQGTSNNAILSVTTVKGGGVVGKIIAGSNGTKSKTYL